MKTLMRSRTNRRIAGICGGLAEQQGWDATIIRLVWVAMVLFGGTGILLYLILWVVLPQEPLTLPARTGYAPVYPSTEVFPPPSQTPGSGS